MTPEDRLAYHRANSLPLFTSIVKECVRVIDKKLVTPNSELGRSFQYVITHQRELCGFCIHPGAPLSNNLVERIILNLVLLRRVSHFFRTQSSAAIADTIWSVGLTAFYSRVNLFHYFRLALRHQQEVRAEPEKWLPWKFLERYPEYEIKQKSRAGRLRNRSDVPYIALQPPA